MVSLVIKDDADYAITLHGHELQKIVDLIGDHVKKTDGVVKRSWVKKDGKNIIVVDGGDASEIPQLEQILAAINKIEEIK